MLGKMGRRFDVHRGYFVLRLAHATKAACEEGCTV